MNTFKKGDRVKRLPERCGDNFLSNTTYVVSDVRRGEIQIEGKGSYWWMTEFFEPVTNNTTNNSMQEFINIKVAKGENPMSKAIQTILFSYGFSWVYGPPDTHFYNIDNHITVDLRRKQLTNTQSREFGILDPVKELSKIIESISIPPPPTFIEVKLNGTHNAKVFKDKIVVGCQEFPITIIDELVKTRIKLNETN